MQASRLAAALEQKKIVDCPPAALSEALFYAMAKVGLRAGNMPENDEWLLLLAHATNLYGHKTPEEIKLAFDLAIDDKLDLELAEVQCYENFSCMYFSKIMNAYRKWAREENKNLPPKPKLMIEHKEDMSDVAMTDWLASLMKNVAAKPDYPVEFIPVTLYDWLDKNGYVQKTTPQQREYMAKAIILRAKVLVSNARENPNEQNIKRRDHFLSLQANGRYWGEDLEDVKSLAKRLLLFDLIKNEEIAI